MNDLYTVQVMYRGRAYTGCGWLWSWADGATEGLCISHMGRRVHRPSRTLIRIVTRAMNAEYSARKAARSADDRWQDA